MARLELKHFWTLMAFMVISLTQSAPVVAEELQCVKSQAILRHKFSYTKKSEMRAVADSVRVADATEKHILTGTKVLCTQSDNPCANLLRAQRRLGFSHVRNTKHFSCSTNYKLSIGSVQKTVPTIMPNDAHIKKMWGLTGKKSANIGMREAWRKSTGDRSVYVAVIDTGVDYNHEDLQGNIAMEYARNVITGDTTNDVMDDNGHGTHVSGTIGALGNNGVGVAGVNWAISIIPVKFLDKDGAGDLYDAIKAVDYITDLKRSQGVPIILSNNSWGGGDYSKPLADAIKDAASEGILFIAAAGNESNNNDRYHSYPADYTSSNVISVGAVDTDGTLAYFSNFGKKSVDIAAPGVDIASTYPGNQYVYESGTSMAAPHVSGAIALLSSTNSDLSMAKLKSKLLSSGKIVSGLKKYVLNGKFLQVDKMLGATK